MGHQNEEQKQEKPDTNNKGPIMCNGVVQMQHKKCDWKECKAECIKKGYKTGCCSPCKGCVCHGKKISAWNDFFQSSYQPNVGGLQ